VIDVKLMEIDDKGRLNLSRKVLLMSEAKKELAHTQSTTN